AIIREFPQVQAMTRTIGIGMPVQRPGEKPIQEGMIAADSTFFGIFTFPLIKGNPSQVLVEPYSLVLSEKASRRYFGKSDAVGETLILDKQYSCKVTGIMKDMPARSHFHSDIILSMTTLSKLMPGMDSTQWNNFGGHTFLLLPEGYSAGKLQSQLPAFIEKYAGLVLKEDKVKFTLSLEPLKYIYLHSKYGSDESGNATNVYIFSCSALLILLIACINFINLSTSISTERAKETGVRKLAGSSTRSLIGQFLIESVMYCLIAFIIALIISSSLLSLFNDLSGKIIAHSIFENPVTILIMLGIASLIGLLAGAYPAWVLSSYKPILVLKGKFATGRKGIRLRQALVVFQFAISVILMIGTIVTWLQLKYMREQPLGFERDQMLVIRMPGNPETDKHYEMYKEEMMKIPGVISASASSGIPGGQYGNSLLDIENAAGQMQRAGIDIFNIDEDFIHQYKIPVVAGRSSSKEMLAGDLENVMINEAAMHKFGYINPQDAIGKRFGQKGKIIGILKDFHYRSLREQIDPLLLFVSNRFMTYLTLNISSAHLRKTMGAVEARWKKLLPESDFNADFLDDTFNNQYKGEANFGRLFLYFSILAIFVSCLGLSGLALFSTLQRKKEISIRKVIGASVPGIVKLITSDFLLPVFIALIIAYPVAWYLMYQWLNGFAFRIQISWWIFALSGFASVIIAFITVSFQSMKAAWANPTSSLRTD
ncbi:MAG TPA: FtsX-like permease family protein, partial [Chryseolinea sp.]|nr:FtsX-like permease family protein [Chryseolinea sp.]